MTPLRQRMIEDMQIRNCLPTPKTRMYSRSPSLPATSPDRQLNFSGGHSYIPGLPDEREEACSQFDTHRRFRHPLSLQSHSQKGLGP